MEPLDRSHKICVIGAGSSGLTVAKNLGQLDIPYDVIERLDDVGGNWYYGQPGSSVYQSTRLISSKRLTEYTDFPMPKEYPEYPSHEQAWDYLRSYAQRHDLYRSIEFGRSIFSIEKSDNAWDITLDGGELRRYAGVVIANGHNSEPKFPEYPGHFGGLTLHSSQYKTPDTLRGQRVLVVGAGNSGCDIAVEAAQNARQALHSTRRGYHYLPKFLLGKPIDKCGERLLRLGVPLALRRAISGFLVRLAIGKPSDYGLPEPDHKLFETHPIINSQMLYYVGHGQIAVKPDVAELRGDRIRFVDGSEAEVDVIIYATGFRITFPFIDPKYLNWRDGRPDLFLNAFHPRDDSLFVAGLIQPDSGQWGLVDCQARLIARFLRAAQSDRRTFEWFRRLKSAGALDLGAGVRYIPSTRHLLEVEHFSYRRRLEKLIARF